MLKNIGLFCVTLLLLSACKDYDSLYTDVSVLEEKAFEGSLLDYLEKGDPERGLKFDSMLRVIEGIPGLKDSLTQVKNPKTVFAIPNAGFKEALLRLNEYREAKGRGEPLSLQDLMIDPFVVIEEQQIGPDSVLIIEHPYDYRLQLDSLISRYIFDGNIETQTLKEYPLGLHTQDDRFGYLMNVLYQREFASGIQQMAKRRLVLSDKNGTQLDELWDRSETQVIDIRTNNGYIHVLADGHEFGFGKLIENFQNYGNEYIYD